MARGSRRSRCPAPLKTLSSALPCVRCRQLPRLARRHALVVVAVHYEQRAGSEAARSVDRSESPERPTPFLERGRVARRLDRADLSGVLEKAPRMIGPVVVCSPGRRRRSARRVAPRQPSTSSIPSCAKRSRNSARSPTAEALALLEGVARRLPDGLGGIRPGAVRGGAARCSHTVHPAGIARRGTARRAADDRRLRHRPSHRDCPRDDRRPIGARPRVRHPESWRPGLYVGTHGGRAAGPHVNVLMQRPRNRTRSVQGELASPISLDGSLMPKNAFASNRSKAWSHDSSG